jgi:hypothetical protein
MYKYMPRAFCRFACVILFFLVSLSFTGCDDSKILTGTTKIDSLEWMVIAEIQELRPCDDSGWEIPDGAVVYDEKEEIKSYKIVGYETKYKTEKYQELIGYYLPTWRPRYETRTRQVSYQEAIKEPIYATKYYYTIDRWVHSINVQLARGYTHDYSYPDYMCEENERVHNVEYTYLVKFTFDGREISYVVDRNKWESLQIGQEISVEKNQYGVIHVDWDNINKTN